MWIDVILGGGFRTVAGPLLFPTGAQLKDYPEVLVNQAT
jgi:hypothetical protein